MIPSDIRLYTWLDVQETLSRAIETNGWPSWLIEAESYWDGVSLLVHPGKSGEAVAWVKETFDPRIFSIDDGLVIRLESLDAERSLSVSIVESLEEPLGPRLRPTLAKPTALTKGLLERLQPSSDPGEGIPIFAFHSFKGGVGRTLHAFGLAHKLVERKAKVLLVDADFEAPGISWLLQSRLPSPPISFADYLAIVHSEPSEPEERGASLVAQRIQDAYLGGIYVLPAFRSVKGFQSLEIRPEHIAQASIDPFIMTTMLRRLAKKLGVDAVIVDLRAGLSELAAGLLLDPRCNRVLVTTTSAQSVSGTEVVLDLMGRKAPSTFDEHPVPIVIVNQVPLEYGRESMTAIEERLLASLNSTIVREDAEESVAIGIRGPSVYDPNLVALPAGWDEVSSLVRNASVKEVLESIADTVAVVRPEPSMASMEPSLTADEARNRLKTTAERFVVAETSQGNDFLPISPLRRLVEDHVSLLPNSIVVGAKGAGKTYTFLQVARRSGWRQFAEDAKASRTAEDALICPVLQPKNLQLDNISEKRRSASAALDLSPPPDHFEITDFVRSALTQEFHEGQWRETWLDVMAWSIGFEVWTKGAGRKLPEFLRTKERRVLFLFDGLEDLFQEIAISQKEQIALRSLLQEVPNWLDQNPDRKLGMLIFVRRDLVTASIKQNSAQLMARYEPYALKWNSTEALRLVAWVCSKAQILPSVSIDQIPDLDQEQLTEELVPLWGRKLGSDRSREGRSAEWVLAALSDFRGQIQGRDIVRLLNLSAIPSLGSVWSDRILAPNAIREAVATCSTQKIREISEENAPLKVIFDKLRQLPDERRSIPFRAEDVNLSASDLYLLEANGVTVNYEGENFMPEIFRRGLDFKLPLGARPRVLALARRRQPEI